MEKVKFIEIQSQFSDESEAFAIIDRGNGEYTSMLKSTYDAMQVAQTEPALPPAPPAEEPVDPTI